MKIFKKLGIILSAILFLTILGTGIYLSRSSKTVDCFGEVTSVDIENQTIHVTDTYNAKYLLKIKFYTTLIDGKNNKITLSDIEVGDYIDANYRGEWRDHDSELTATYIKMTKSHANSLG